MSGHSKWSTIKHKKAKLDSKRGKIFTKISKEITVAVKLGGAEPEGNSRLKLALIKARGNNIPNDNIIRVIKKAAGEESTSNFEELVYEGYGIGGAAVIVECLTDNRNRTAGEIRHIFDKFDGVMGATGCVSWMFDKVGEVKISGELDFAEIEIFALENNCLNCYESSGDIVFETKFEDFFKFNDILLSEGFNINSSSIVRVPNVNTIVEKEEEAKKIINMMNAFEDNDDVQNTYSNFEFSREVLDVLE